MGSEFPSVGWNMFTVWTESLVLVRPRTQQWKVSREENFSLGQVKIESTNVLISLSPFVQGGEQKARIVQG